MLKIRCRNCRTPLPVSRWQSLRRRIPAFAIGVPIAALTFAILHEAPYIGPAYWPISVYCVKCETWNRV